MNPHAQRLIAASKKETNPVPKAQAAKAKAKAKSSTKGKGKGQTTKNGTGGKGKDGKGKDGKSKAKIPKQPTGDDEGLSTYAAAKKKFMEDPSTLGLGAVTSLVHMSLECVLKSKTTPSSRSFIPGSQTTPTRRSRRCFLAAFYVWRLCRFKKKHHKQNHLRWKESQEFWDEIDRMGHNEAKKRKFI